MQNFAARLPTNTKKFDHVTPVLRELQRPSVKSQLEVGMSHFCMGLSMDLRLLTLPVRSAKGRIVTAQGINISYNLPFVELLPLSVPFFIVQ